MNGLVTERLDTIRMLRTDKQEISLNLEAMRTLDTYLQDEWGIRLISPEESQQEIQSLPAYLSEKFSTVYHDRIDLIEAGESIPLGLENHFYNLLAEEKICATIHSMKRVFILDAIAWTTAVLRLLKLRGSVLDIGCHVGYLSKYLAENLDANVNVIGSDRSENAIAVANRHGESVPNVEFMVWDYTNAPVLNQKFDAVICSDSMPSNGLAYEKVLRSMAGMLNEGGIFIDVGGISTWQHSPELRRAARDTGLSYGIADVIGGYDGEKFQGNPVLLLIKSEGDPLPLELVPIVNEGWEESGFPDYANGDVPWEEKSIGYFRAKHRESR